MKLLLVLSVLMASLLAVTAIPQYYSNYGDYGGGRRGGGGRQYHRQRNQYQDYGGYDYGNYNQGYNNNQGYNQGGNQGYNQAPVHQAPAPPPPPAPVPPPSGTNAVAGGQAAAVGPGVNHSGSVARSQNVDFQLGPIKVSSSLAGALAGAVNIQGLPQIQFPWQGK